MGKFLRLVNGVPRSVEESGNPVIYDKTIEIVASGPIGNQLVGPIAAGTNITLPASQTFTGAELQVYLNGSRQDSNALDNILDYNIISSTQIQMTFSLEVDDKLRFYIDRAP